MPTKKEMFQGIMREYDRIQNQKAAELRVRKEFVFQQIPRLKEIEEEVSMAGIKIASMVLSSPEKSEYLIEKLKTRLQNLKEEKNALLEEKGYHPRYLELEYVCDKCKDTGFVDTQKCICLKQKLMDVAYNQSNVRDIIARENFDTFDIRYYSDVTDPKEKKSPRENIQSILRECMYFTQEFDKECSNLLLYGSTGLGKTFLCNCIAKELLDKGKTVLYVTAGQLFKMVEDHRFRRDEEEVPNGFMEDIMEADLFIIDDLGTEFSTILSSAELFQIINTRMLEKKSVILSTNLAPSDLMNQYSDRIVSRLLGDYKPLKFFGEDIRIKKKYAR